MTPSPQQGLSSEEAARQLQQIGPNAVVEPHVSPVVRIARRFWEPVPWMLEAAVVLQLAIGEPVEALIIAALLIFNVALGVFQEGRANTALAALKSELALTAFVMRDGRWIETPAAGLAPGDVVRIALGGIVPADARILNGSVLLDQSMLTGESVPVEIGREKTAYAGALVRKGAATAEIIATGQRTYFGKTAELVRIAHAESGEQKAVLGVVRNLAVFNGVIVVLLVAYARSIAIPVDQRHTSRVDGVACFHSRCAAGDLHARRGFECRGLDQKGSAPDPSGGDPRGGDRRCPVRRQDRNAHA